MDRFFEETSLSTVIGMFIILVGLMLFLMAMIKAAKARTERYNDQQEIQSGHAKVVSMDELPPNAVRSVSSRFVIFELDTGERVRVCVPATKLICVGDHGKLVWQGTRMNRFDRE